VSKKLSYLLFLAGLLLILFPIVREWHYEWKQDRLLEQLMESSAKPAIEERGDRSLSESNDNLTALFMQQSVEESEASDDDRDEQPEQPQVQQAIGIISIKKIDLKLPILEGATNENMKFAAAHVKETSAIGEVGNAAVAAHRARTKGRLFNRLNEMKVGDEIVVQAGGKTLNYTVYEISRVEPTDVSVLGRNSRDRILTLITCDPLVNPTHRLIVKAKIGEKEKVRLD